MFFEFLVLVTILSPSLALSQEPCGRSIQSPVTNNLHFPWIAELFSTVNKTKKGEFQHLCGSTIISSSFAVTAGHCINEKDSTYKRSASEIFLLANVYDLKQTNESQKIDMQKIISHPDWNPQTESYDGDIAILHFKEPLNDQITPICLWNDDSEKATHGKILTFIALEEGDPGYDNHHFDENNNYPKEFTMPIRSECVKIQSRFESIQSNRTFCAGGLNSGACLEVGNSGSSIAVEIDGAYFIRGIVSASFIDFAGCDNYTFTLFTDVLKYKVWINENINLY